jgi:hypothetical protein
MRVQGLCIETIQEGLPEICLIVYCIVKGKGEATSLQAWTGPEGSRRLRVPDFTIIGT